MLPLASRVKATEQMAKPALPVHDRGRDEK
jgi:hypothetical protein